MEVEHNQKHLYSPKGTRFIKMTLIKAVVLTTAFIIFAMFVGSWIFLFDTSTPSITIIEAYSSINALIEFVFIFLFLRIITGSYSFIIKKTRVDHLIIALALGAIYPYVQSPMNVIYNAIFSTSYKVSVNFDIEELFVLNSIGSILIIPVVEELFFRAFLLNGLLKNYTAKTAIIFSSFLFAAIHLPFASLFFENISFDIHHFYITFFGGLIAASLYYRSKSVVPCILFHMAWNFIATIT